MIGFLKCLRTYNSVASNIKNNNKMLEQTGLENKRNFLKNITEKFGSLRPVWSRNHVTRSCASPLLSLGFSTCKSGFPHGNNTGVSCRSIMQEYHVPGLTSTHLQFPMKIKGFSASTSCWEVSEKPEPTTFCMSLAHLGYILIPPIRLATLTGFSWGHYFNKSFAPKSLAKVLLVVESSLRHKWMHWNPWQVILENPELFFFIYTSLQKLAFHSVNKTLIFSHSPFPRFCAAPPLTQPPTSPAPLKSLPCALWKHHFTVNCP